MAGHFQPLVWRRTTATVEMHYNRDYEGDANSAGGFSQRIGWL